eukprot:COSAG01_NODE_48_length_31904_cov_21.696997_3_plen_492_part_00
MLPRPGGAAHTPQPLLGGATWNAVCPWPNDKKLGCKHTCTATCPTVSSVQTSYYCDGAGNGIDPGCILRQQLIINGAGDNLHCPCAALGDPPAQSTWLDSTCKTAVKDSDQSCTAKCWEGHHYAGGSEVYNCTDGVWGNGGLVCEPDPCLFDALTPKDHVVMSGESGRGCVAGGTVTSGESCITECSTGYFKSGGATKYTCREGQWHPAAVNTECTADGTCPGTDPNPNGEWVGTCLPRRDMTCVSQCREDYQRNSGNLKFKCNVDDQGVGTWMPVGFNYTADTACVACWDQQADKPAHCYCTDPPADNAVCAGMEGHRAGAADSECEPVCVPGYHHEEEEQPFRCTVVNGTGQWVGGSSQCLEGSTDSRTGRSGVSPEYAVLITLGVLAVLSCVVYKCLWPRFCQREVAQNRLLRQSLLGGAEMMPAAKLARVDAAARWSRAQATQLQGDSERSDVPANRSRNHMGSSDGSASYRQVTHTAAAARTVWRC